MNHFIDIDQLKSDVIKQILRRASNFKADVKMARHLLEDKTLVLVFEKPSTRTRVSFEVGMRQLGGNVITLSEKDSQLGRGETAADTSRVLSRYADIVMLRTDSHQKLIDFARFASVPVINGLTDQSHPCQIMADILTFEEHCGPIEGKSIAWVGDGNNVATSWLQAATLLGFELRIASPTELQLQQFLLDKAVKKGGQIKTFTDAAEAVDGVDCVVADTWVSMGDDWEYAKRQELLSPYQVNAELMSKAKKEAIFMHCLPAHRGQEVTADVLDGPQSVIWDEAENRLHAQKGILAWCLEC